MNCVGRHRDGAQPTIADDVTTDAPRRHFGVGACSGLSNIRAWRSTVVPWAGARQSRLTGRRLARRGFLHRVGHGEIGDRRPDAVAPGPPVPAFTVAGSSPATGSLQIPRPNPTHGLRSPDTEALPTPSGRPYRKLLADGSAGSSSPRVRRNSPARAGRQSGTNRRGCIATGAAARSGSRSAAPMPRSPP